MIWTIYALRLRGEQEVRYVGQTTRLLEERLFGHFSHAKQHIIHRPFTRWLIDNEGTVEPVALSTSYTAADARAAERAMVELFLRLDHRLFNRWLVPAALRIAA